MISECTSAYYNGFNVIINKNELNTIVDNIK